MATSRDPLRGRRISLINPPHARRVVRSRGHSRAADQTIVTGPRVAVVVATSADEVVVTVSSPEIISCLAAVEPVVAVLATKPVVVLESANRVSAATAPSISGVYSVRKVWYQLNPEGITIAGEPCSG
jgi:hypothetical protein